jgi:hypothetical protein
MSVDHGGVILTRGDVSQRHYVHHRFYVDWPGMDMESPQQKSGNLPPEQTMKNVSITCMLTLHSSLTELYRSARFDACSFKYFILVPLKVGYVYDITLILFEPFNAGIKSLCATAACRDL